MAYHIGRISPKSLKTVVILNLTFRIAFTTHLHTQIGDADSDQVQAYRWYTITVKGQDCHTGTTDFADRADALLATAKMILQSHRIATEHGCLASTGILNLSPGSTNTVPGLVRFSLDLRTGEDDRLMRFEDALRADFERIAKGEDVGGLNNGTTQGRECSIEWKLDSPSGAVRFDADCIKCVAESCHAMFGGQTSASTQIITSGAGE